MIMTITIKSNERDMVMYRPKPAQRNTLNRGGGVEVGAGMKALMEEVFEVRWEIRHERIFNERADRDRYLYFSICQ